MEKIYYSLEEARKILPLISRKFSKILRLKAAVELLDSFSIESEDYNMQYDLMALEMQKKYHKLMFKLFNEIQKLTSVGVIIKDLDAGLIDFYSIFQDREIFLCWRYGEATIYSWHEVENGFEDRKDVSSLESKKFYRRK